MSDAWTDQDYSNLLEIMDYGDTSELTPEELKEICSMPLTDNEPEDAAKIVLEHIFKNRLTKGQIENLSNEMLEDKIWEEYVDPSLHEAFFNINQLLYEAYNEKFPQLDAVKFQVKVTALQKDGLAVFKGFPETALIRLSVMLILTIAMLIYFKTRPKRFWLCPTD